MDEEIQSPVDVEGLVNCMKKELRSISESPPFHICQVPATLLKDNHVYYHPKIVSIGPFHRQGPNLQAMEEHKWRYLCNFLGHCANENALEECVKKLKEIEEEARKCYRGNINMGPHDKFEFVKMMLLDGSFIIQLLLFRDEIKKNDPFRRTLWMGPAIAADMLLLENQLPFCVLKCLAECIRGNADALKREALQFFSSSLPGTLNFEQNAKNGTPLDICHITSDIHHLLHLVHQQSLKPACPPTKKPFCAQLLQVVRKILSFLSLGRLANNEHEYEPLTGVQEAGASSNTGQSQEAGASSVQIPEQAITIPTATELEEAGVVFKRNKGGSFLDVTFENGVMRLPRLQITDDTNSLFRNIIAFEQCFGDSGVDFTNYCIFMDSLVNTARDVQILKRSDIIENHLGSDKEVARLFNQLCKEIARDFRKRPLGKVCEDVNQYAKTTCHRWRATLKHDYFSNPWAVISFIAAVYVIILGSAQTYYAIF